jgi:hypothetical protein
MFAHALRCIESDYPELIQNAMLLGVLELDENNQPYEKNGGCWDFIGYKPIDEEGGVAEDGQGNKYVHINAKTPLDVDAIARALAGTYPEIALGLVEFNRFFITDPETGKWAWPAFPLRVFS